MEKQVIKEELMNVIEKYGFKIIGIDKAPSGISGHLSLLDKDKNYIFVKCEKEIDSADEENNKKIKLILRYTIEYDDYDKDNGIAFDYQTGGNSVCVVKKLEDVENHFRADLRCHNLYSYEELDNLKNKNNTITLFDFM